MSFFNDLKQADKLVESKDIVFSGFSPLTANVYDAVVKYAYTGEAKSGAKFIQFCFELDTDKGKREHNETMYITNKNKETFYVKNGEKYPMLGYEHSQAIAALGAGKKLLDMDTTEKILELYDFESRGKKPTKVQHFPDLEGVSIKIGLILTKEYKTKLQGSEYVPTDEVKEFNSIDKVFRSKDNKTMVEVKAKKDTAEFITEWLDANKDKVRDKTKGVTPKIITGSNGTSTATTTVEVDDDLFA